MSSIYLKCGNIQITDSESCFFLNPIGFQEIGFSNILSKGVNSIIDRPFYDKTLFGLNAFYKSTYDIVENKKVDNLKYIHKPDKYLNYEFYTTQRYTKVERFSYAPIILNSQIHRKINEVNNIIKRRSSHDGYVPKCRGRFEIYNEENKLIFSDALFPIKVKTLISIKKPFNLHAQDFGNEKRNFQFKFNPMIIPIKLPNRIQTFPAKGLFAAPSFNVHNTYTYFSIDGNELTIGLSKEEKPPYDYVNLQFSKNFTERYGGEFVNLTEIKTDSVLQEDLFFIVAEAPTYITNNKYRQSSGVGQAENDSFPIDYLYV